MEFPDDMRERRNGQPGGRCSRDYDCPPENDDDEECCDQSRLEEETILKVILRKVEIEIYTF